MFLVSHSSILHEGLMQSETLVLNEANIVTPALYNTHAVFNQIPEKIDH
jgi:hypothetical protein